MYKLASNALHVRVLVVHMILSDSHTYVFVWWWWRWCVCVCVYVCVCRKTTAMDPQRGEAWIGFGHVFAAEGEHDQVRKQCVKCIMCACVCLWADRNLVLCDSQTRELHMCV
jgi:hypothetical protein